MPRTAIIAGTYYDNAEKTRPRDIIRRCCKVGQRVLLRRELNNPHDPNAVAVLVKVRRLFWSRYKRMGYLNVGVAVPLSERLNRGEKVEATIKSVSAPEGETAPQITIEFE